MAGAARPGSMSDSDVNHNQAPSAGTETGAAATPVRPSWPLPRSAPTAVADDGHSLFLGLFLILLAFFVMLTALSQREENRTRAVLASLRAAFAAGVPASEARRHPLGPEPAAAAGAALTALDALLAASLPLLAAPPERAGDRLVLRFSADALFAAGSAEPRPAARRVLLGRLADALAAPPPGLRAEATVTVGTPDVIPTTAAARLAADRAGALARALADSGAPAPRLVLGVGETHPEEIVAEVTVRAAPVSESGGDAER